MRIRLRNRTKFRTGDVRGLVKSSLRAVGCNMKGTRTLEVDVGYSRRTLSTGEADLGRNRVQHGRTMKLNFPRPAKWTDDTWREVVAVTVHECMHLVGSEHKDMTEAQRHCTLPLPAWTEGLIPLREMEAVPELVRKAAARGDRLEHAHTMLRKAEARVEQSSSSLRQAQTRAKRDQTILEKWKRRVSAMERISPAG